MPEHVLRRLVTEYKGEFKKCRNLNQDPDKKPFPIDAIYLTPSSPHQLAMLPDISVGVELKAGVDALYVTRLQKERQAPTAEVQDLKKGYPVVDKKLLKAQGFEKTLVMHPLPRVDELTHEMDADPRSMYFKQAAYGMPVRMALLALLLGAREVAIPEEEDSLIRKIGYPVYKRDSGVKCPNTNCVSNQETEVRYIKPEFRIVGASTATMNFILNM
jgi:hypothetical protein